MLQLSHDACAYVLSLLVFDSRQWFGLFLACAFLCSCTFWWLWGSVWPPGPFDLGVQTMNIKHYKHLW